VNNFVMLMDAVYKMDSWLIYVQVHCFHYMGHI